MDIHNHVLLGLISSWMGIVILYVGPETMIPFLSFLAAFFGVILMFWRRIMGLARKVFQFTRSKFEK